MAFSHGGKYLATVSRIENNLNGNSSGYCRVIFLEIESKTIFHEFRKIHDSNNNNNKKYISIVVVMIMWYDLIILLDVHFNLNLFCYQFITTF